MTTFKLIQIEFELHYTFTMNVKNNNNEIKTRSIRMINQFSFRSILLSYILELLSFDIGFLFSMNISLFWSGFHFHLAKSAVYNCLSDDRFECVCACVCECEKRNKDQCLKAN